MSPPWGPSPPSPCMHACTHTAHGIEYFSTQGARHREPVPPRIVHKQAAVLSKRHNDLRAGDAQYDGYAVLGLVVGVVQRQRAAAIAGQEWTGAASVTSATAAAAGRAWRQRVGTYRAPVADGEDTCDFGLRAEGCPAAVASGRTEHCSVECALTA